MKNKTKKLLSAVIALCITLTLLIPWQVQAAVKMSETRKTLDVGQSITLKVKGTSKKVKWSSDDTWVATVTKTGKVTAKNEGTATITAKVAKKTLKCKVTVKYPEIEVDRTNVYKDNNISIYFTGISGYLLGYAIDFEIENLSNRSLLIMNEETSINGYMRNEASCYIEVSPGKKIKDAISISGSEADEIPIRKVKNIETKFKICDDNDSDFDYETHMIQIMGSSSGSSDADYSGETIGFEKDLARKCLTVSPYVIPGGAVATVKSTYEINTEIDITFAFYDSFGKLIDSQVAEDVQVVKDIPTNAHVESDRNGISKVKATISDVRRGNSKNHPEKISLTNKNGSRSGVSAQVNNLGNENFGDIRLSCVFLKDGNPVGCSVEYIDHIPKYSHSFVTFDVPKQEKHLRDSDGDWYWDYVAIDCDQYAILIDYAYYE